MIKPVKSSRTGTLPCVRVISGACRLAPQVAEVLAVAAQVALEAALAQLAVLALRALLVQLVVLVPVEVVAELAVAVVSVEVRRSFSAAMVGNLPPAGTPRYAPVPRSGRKAKRRP